MTEQQLSAYYDRTYNRLTKTFKMTHEQAFFVIAYADYTHATREDAYDSIHRFLDSKGI